MSIRARKCLPPEPVFLTCDDDDKNDRFQLECRFSNGSGGGNSAENEIISSKIEHLLICIRSVRIIAECCCAKCKVSQ